MDFLNRKIEAQEKTDFEFYVRFLEKTAKGKFTLERTKQYAKYDAVQKNNETDEKMVVELKSRNVTYEQYPDYIFSFHKLDELQEGKRLNEAKKAFFVALYPLSGKIVIFDLTDLDSSNAETSWVYLKKTEYKDKSEKEWQPVVKLELQPSEHKHYKTYVFDFEMPDYEEVYQKYFDWLGNDNNL